MPAEDRARAGGIEFLFFLPYPQRKGNMSGTFKINAEAIWMPTGWIYDGILQRIIFELNKEDLQIAQSLRQAKMDMYQFIDLQTFSKQDIALILFASESAFKIAVHQGAKEFSDPKGYTHYMLAFSELKALLRLHFYNVDSVPISSGTLKIRANAIWISNEINFDLIVENLLTSISSDNMSYSLQLLAARVAEGQGNFDIGLVDNKLFKLLADPLEKLFRFYGDGKGRVSYAPAFFASLASDIAELHHLYMNDERINNF